MNFPQFLNQLHDFNSGNHNLVHFKGDKAYPLLFFTLFFDQYKRSSDTQIELIDFHETDASIVQARLETSFLGNSSIFWLRSLSELDDKKRVWWTTYLKLYSGPNQIWFFSLSEHDIKLSTTTLTIEIPDTIDQKTFIQLLALHQKKPSAGAQQLIKKLFGTHERIQLDIACVLIHYVLLLGNNSAEFIDSWLNAILVPEQSLFTLSTHFFSKNGRAFFALWPTMMLAYPEQFWIAYWSEQLWRASNFVSLAQSNAHVEAKKIGFRLPFSFMQKDWRNSSAQELTNAHNFLYSCDGALKNGCNVPGLELMYMKFFQGEFRK